MPARKSKDLSCPKLNRPRAEDLVPHVPRNPLTAPRNSPFLTFGSSISEDSHPRGVFGSPLDRAAVPGAQILLKLGIFRKKNLFLADCGTAVMHPPKSVVPAA